MEQITAYLGRINDNLVWGPPMLVLILAIGIVIAFAGGRPAMISGAAGSSG